MNHKYIKNLAIKNGFDLCGIAKVEPIPSFKEHMEGWIARGFNAGMAWMERNNNIRADVSLLMDGAKTIVIVAKSYLGKEYDMTVPRVARYAQNTDYHITMRESMEKMALELKEAFGVASRCCVDTAPLAERYWAQQAGLGWIGRSGMLVTREFGGYTTLGALILDKECDEYDTPSEFNGCGGCNRCLTSCPTGAIGANGTLDCRSCLSYLTVEHRGQWDAETGKRMENSEWLYGCDRCIEVCPWSIAAERRQLPQNEIPMPYTRAELLNIPNLSNSAFKRLFGATPLFHSGKKNIERNICIVIESEVVKH